MSKHILKRVVTISLCMVMMFCGTFAFGSGAEAKAAPNPRIVTAIKNNKTYYVMNPLMLKWYKGYKPGTTKTKIYARYFEKSHPAVVELKWRLTGAGGNTALKNVTVKVSRTKNMNNSKKNPVKTYKVKGELLELTNLLAGQRYYWQVSGKYRGKILKSLRYTFKTNRTPRTLKVDGISNVRDIGGYKVPTGRVKQGMIYRSANLDQLSTKGKTLLKKDLGIKKELDLRDPTNSSEYYLGKIMPLGAKKYKNISGVQYDQLYVVGAKGYNPNRIAQEIAFFANKNNYPIILHCMIGRDRTGTLSFLLNALLGVSKRNLFIDYEMSFFSVSGCSSLTKSNNLVAKTTALYNYINRNYGTANSTFAQKTELFLIERGVTMAQINNIRKIMIEK